MADRRGFTGQLADPDVRHRRAVNAARARSTPAHHLDKIRQLVAESRAAQGLPPVVVDELTLSRVAEIFKLAEQSTGPDDQAVA